ncbi:MULTISPECIES: methyltransferase domain-containing protein [unclassified Streptomyces]|uniref:class I SAM-dependent methyltransferase n=1 Tax=unclassified Streptomyces TaxID=2593676 RepID=UPI0033E1045F
MGFYAEQVLPRIIDVACGVKMTAPLRRRVCGGLRGQVVEIGFGTGHNVPYYPSTVEGVVAIEPSDVGWRLAAARVGAASVPVRRAGPDGQSLPFEDHSFDTALSTWTLSPSPTPGPRCAKCAVCCGPAGHCTSWSTGSHRKRTRTYAAGSDAWNR